MANNCGIKKDLVASDVPETVESDDDDDGDENDNMANGGGDGASGEDIHSIITTINFNTKLFILR